MPLLPKPNNNIIIFIKGVAQIQLALGGFQVSQNLRIPALNILNY